MRHLSLVLLLSVFWSSVLAGPYLTYRDGVEEYERGNYEAAFATFQRLAEQGDARAQNALGHMYFLGEGVAEDYAAATTWFHRAANQGIVAAQLSLADLYFRGLGVVRSEVDAYMWYSLSVVFAPDDNRKRLATARRDQLDRNLKVAERLEGRRRACAWWRKFRGTPPDKALGACAEE